MFGGIYNILYTSFIYHYIYIISVRAGSDATQAGHPLVFAGEGFFKMTGYEPAEILGCRSNSGQIMVK